MSQSDSFARRVAYLAYGSACYAIFLATFLYAVGFVGGYWKALGFGAGFRSMDAGGPPATPLQAVLFDAALLALFALQHSGMARRGFKRWWTRTIPEPIERSTFVLATSLCLGVLFWQWRPIGTAVLWDLSRTSFEPAFVALSFVGFGIVLVSTFLIDHFDLFGLRQVWLAFRGRPHPGLEFRTPGLYRAVRHPIYLGFIIAFWATPTMTVGHLVFAAATTGYILVAIQLEERDLVHRYGEAYRQYRRRTGMLLPVLAPPPREPHVFGHGDEGSRARSLDRSRPAGGA
jgi:methanethiol S-methyltransferase